MEIARALVLVPSRGGYCPKDRRQAEGLVALLRELEVGSGVGAHWPFLSDAGRIVQKDLDIAEYTDPANKPMIPYVI